MRKIGTEEEVGGPIQAGGLCEPRLAYIVCVRDGRIVEYG